jgi:TonB-dependent SusC/RagA subfamily outer membrane receptor
MPFVAFMLFNCEITFLIYKIPHMKKILLSFLVVFACVTLAFSQNVVITGKVTDQKDGSALPGVSVTVKGSPTIGAQTDINGGYRLAVPAGAQSLTFRFIGYKDAEATISGSVINVQLETDSKLLNEVVVVGYGTQKRQSITGSIASVSAKEIENTPVTTLEQAIQGKAAGVVIQSNNGKLGQGIKISVRGTSSVSAGTQPLVVLDGVIINSSDISTTSAATNPLADLNFNDFESVDILKDASAAAIYGARASNGVILLTSKKGKIGKSKINFSAQFGSSKPSRHREFLNTEQYIQLQRRAGVGASGPDFDAGYYDSLQDALDDYNSYVEGKFTTYAAGSTDWTATNTNWESLAYQDAPQSQYDLNISWWQR